MNMERLLQTLIPGSERDERCKTSHDDARRRVCLFCFRKVSRELCRLKKCTVTRTLQQVIIFIWQEYDTNDLRLPCKLIMIAFCKKLWKISRSRSNFYTGQVLPILSLNVGQTTLFFWFLKAIVTLPNIISYPCKRNRRKLNRSSMSWTCRFNLPCLSDSTSRLSRESEGTSSACHLLRQQFQSSNPYSRQMSLSPLWSG